MLTSSLMNIPCAYVYRRESRNFPHLREDSVLVLTRCDMYHPAVFKRDVTHRLRNPGSHFK